eukprot:CAMPEP_0197178256 /NCGR_PEP_ID=MMETSP1423-20130617/3599_1 /TAXON_ID=476441 /ORGANISM="Pseudo-nitzschia heimii, Strain UNC1101" /LENGTH=582 /DNA_ID=CAMNT_0042627963 /DNA_START=470 /DNA_END=2215 /DNA_ORIENTATION=+
MTAICSSHYRNPLNDFVGKKHHHQHRFRPRQSTRSAFYKPGLRVIESRGNNNNKHDSSLFRDDPTASATAAQQQEHQQLEVGDSRCGGEPEGHWGFRPSALQREDYGRGGMSVPDIVDWYVRDNERAEREGVAVPPRPSLSDRVNNSSNNNSKRKLRDVRDALFSASSSSSESSAAASSLSSSSSSSSSVLRCLQWNIQAFSSPKDERNMHTITAGIIRSICETDSDVLVLNEIHWKEATTADSSCSTCHGGYYHCESTKKAIRSSQALLEEVLRLRGYHYSRVAGHGDTPTMIATRKKVLASKEVVLSDNRSALCLLLELGGGSARCWAVGTHLDAFCAGRRRSEIRKLLDEADRSGGVVPVLVAGDFNQQRCRDYTPSEWRRVGASADLRGVPRDDGVADLLEEGGFRCVLDDVRAGGGRGEVDYSAAAESESSTSSTTKVACNWDQSQPPPSTHWSGTTIDYTYYHNHHRRGGGGDASAVVPSTVLAPHGVYVGPAGFSDHRMTVTDWVLTVTAPANRATASEEKGPRPNHIDKDFFFHHLPDGRHRSWLYNKQSSPVPRSTTTTGTTTGNNRAAPPGE